MKNCIIHIKFFIAIFLIALAPFTSSAQNIQEELETNLERWRTSYSPEKVYLHHDKPYYAPGQHLWLKGYVVDASTLKPSKKSSILYVDLLHNDHKPVEQLTLKVENGRTHGDIILPADLKEGIYKLIAHTQWMRNFGEETFFTKEIRIVGTSVIDKASPTLRSNDIDLQFFPEGGDMVNGILSTVAFKSVSADGFGVPIHGSIFDDEGKKITEFNDFHLGMGAFSLRPEDGRRYFAKVNFNDGNTIDYPLPAAREEGYVLSIDEKSNPKHIEVTVRGNPGADNKLILTAISQDAVKFSKNVVVKNGEIFQDRVARKLFPTGITRFNLSTTEGKPLAERLVFVDHHDQLNISVTTDKSDYIAREQVTLKIEVTDKNGNPIATDLSLAITDNELVKPSPYGQNIQSYLLLSSDLRGHIEQPGYYFESNDQQRIEALRYLMMTQGWRRFTWSDARTGTFPAINHMNEVGLTIKGKLITNKGEPVKNGEAILYLKDQHESFIITETDQQGAFFFDGFNFNDSIEVVIQGTDTKGRRKHLEVKMDETNFRPNFPAYSLPPADNLTASIGRDFLSVSNRQTAYVEQAISAQTLKAIMLKDVVIEGRAEIVDTYSLHNRADAVLTPADLPIAPSGNILESLQGRVAGLQVVRAGPHDFRAIIRGQGPPLYLLDGIPIPESSLISINQFDIGRIEILKNRAAAAIYGGRAAYGVIALYSRTGAEQYYVESRPGKYIIVHRVGGYSKVREFYSPRYGDGKPGDELPDLRTTLYWSPSVTTDENGIGTISFFTADRNTSYKVVTEGISKDGVPGRGEMTFKVTRQDVTP